MRPPRILITTAIATAMLLASASIASAGTVSLWHMDEPKDATTMVDSVGPNDGTLHNIALGQPGFLGGAYGFDGSTSVVIGPTGGGLNAGSSPFWFGARVKFPNPPSAAVVDYDLMRKGLSSEASWWKIEVFQSGQIHCSMEGSLTSRSLTAGPDLSDNRWHSVYCVKDGTTERIVVDGVVVGTESVTLGDFGNNAVLAIGGKAEGGDQYEGLMDDASYGLGTTVTNSAPPAVNGVPEVGTTVSASTGSWDGLPDIAYTYQWQRCDPAGASCATIAGATQGAYTVAAADVGSTLRVVVTAKNALDQTSATSAATGVVVAAGPGTPPPAGGGTPPPAGGDTPSAPVGGADVPSARPVVATSCTRLTSSASLRKGRLRGGKTMTLRLDVRTGTLQFRAARRTVRWVRFTLDDKRIGSARGGSLKRVLQAGRLAAGSHVVRATVQPRRGKPRTLTMRLTVVSC